MSLSTKWFLFAALVACLPSALGIKIDVGNSFFDEVQRNKRATVKATFKNGTGGSDYCNCECAAGCKPTCPVCTPAPCTTCDIPTTAPTPEPTTTTPEEPTTTPAPPTTTPEPTTTTETPTPEPVDPPIDPGYCSCCSTPPPIEYCPVCQK